MYDLFYLQLVLTEQNNFIKIIFLKNFMKRKNHNTILYY